MLRICSIEKQSAGRYRILLEDGTAFPLYGKELAAYGIEEDGFLKEDDFQEIITVLLPKRARSRAMHLLQSMDRTESQLREKLSSGGYPQEIVEDAVEYVRRFHYIDDVRYAVAYMEYRKESRSLRQMEQELYRKGISRESFAAAREQIDEPDEEQQIRCLLQKKGYCPKTSDQKEKERFIRFLLRRGYGISAIQRVIRSIDLYE